MPINYFGLIISAFPSAFFLLLSPARDPHQLQLQLLGAKAIPKAGLLFAGLCHLRSGRPGISPCHSRAASTGSTLPPCLHPSRAARTPEPKWWGATMSSGADWSCQGRRRMERGMEGGLPRAKCSTRRAAGAGQAGPQGKDGISQTFPRLTQAFQVCARRQGMLCSCWGFALQESRLLCFPWATRPRR